MPPPGNAMLPPKNRGIKSRFFDWVRNKVVAIKGALLAPTKQVTDFLVHALGELTKLVARHPDRSGQPRKEIANPQTAKDFKHNLDIIIKESSLGDFYRDTSYLEEVAAKAAQLKNDPNNLLREPHQLQSLSKLALYQPVLYCDDSGSMSWSTEIEGTDRKSAQAALVKRIASIVTRAVPGKGGVHLRFINQTSAYDDLDAGEIEAKMQFAPDGGTLLGQSLRAKVLQPLLYDVVGGGEPLARPLLVLTITDGCPNSPDTFRDEIVECGQYLVKNGYQKAAVRFDLSQVGSDQDAVAFLKGLSQDGEIRDVLHCTAEHLDATFAKLRDNEQNLEEWLLEKLCMPVRLVD